MIVTLTKRRTNKQSHRGDLLVANRLFMQPTCDIANNLFWNNKKKNFSSVHLDEKFVFVFFVGQLSHSIRKTIDLDKTTEMKKK